MNKSQMAEIVSLSSALGGNTMSRQDKRLWKAFDEGARDAEDRIIKLLDNPEFRSAVLSAATYFVGFDYDAVQWGLAKAKAKAEAVAMIRGTQ